MRQTIYDRQHGRIAMRLRLARRAMAFEIHDALAPPISYRPVATMYYIAGADDMQ